MADSIEEKSWIKKLLDSRAFRCGIGIPVALVLILYIASYFLDEPLSAGRAKLDSDISGKAAL
jgi:hypothetical protein